MKAQTDFTAQQISLMIDSFGGRFIINALIITILTQYPFSLEAKSHNYVTAKITSLSC